MTIHMEIRPERKSHQKIIAFAKTTNQSFLQDTITIMHQEQQSLQQDLITNTIGSALDLQLNLTLLTIEDMN